MSLKKFFLEKKKKKFKKKYKVGLCLSGGGTRGLSYLGVFKAFEECGIKFDAVAGASAGSIFGAMYATGMSTDEMFKKTKDMKNSDFRKSKLGFLPSKMDAMNESLKKVLEVEKIEDLKIPFYTVAVDLRTGNEVQFSKGDLATVITGSCAIPGVFCPVKYENMLLIDGGVANNIPVDVLKDNGCDFVVTIDCNCTRGGGTNSKNLISQFIASIGIMMVNNSKKGLLLSDIVICPDLKKFSSLNMSGKEEMIEEGYLATMEAIPQIEELFMGKLKKK